MKVQSFASKNNSFNASLEVYPSVVNKTMKFREIQKDLNFCSINLLYKLNFLATKIPATR